jgi:hypothetical protein
LLAAAAGRGEHDGHRDRDGDGGEDSEEREARAPAPPEGLRSSQAEPLVRVDGLKFHRRGKYAPGFRPTIDEEVRWESP